MISATMIRASVRWLGALAVFVPSLALAQASSTSVRQSLDDAWWTGPIEAASPGTLPPGHVLLEPYFYDARTPHTNSIGSSTFMIVGLADRLAAGLIPVFGYNAVGNGPSSSRAGIGDFKLLGQYRLTTYRAGSWLPTTAFVFQQTLPTGRYDRLGDRPSDGLGAGAYTTSLAVYSQTYFWMPNGRILRTRLDVSQTFSSDATVRDVSVYGTGAGFRGHARPGPTFFADAAWEYSLTRSWVLATDVTYAVNGNTSVVGYDIANQAQSQAASVSIKSSSGTSESFGFAPAVEYNWTPNLGVIIGVRQTVPVRNTISTLTPVMAINFVR